MFHLCCIVLVGLLLLIRFSVRVRVMPNLVGQGLGLVLGFVLCLIWMDKV